MGPLHGYTIIELAGMGPCPMAGMLLADMGAEVIRVERSKERKAMYAHDISARGKKSIVVDLKHSAGKKIILQLVKKADAIIEGFRPGVCEKLGIGPKECQAQNPALVYGRMTGWGQEGPWSQTAGHDINYIALTGALHAIGRHDQAPVPPLNLLGDFGGGAMFLISGVLAALLESKKSGCGQVVDAAMIDGVANLMWMAHRFQATGNWNVDARGSNMLDSGAFFYDAYQTADGKFMALGAIEPQFFSEFSKRAHLDVSIFNPALQHKKKQWPALKQQLAKVFLSKTQQQWCAIFGDSDACVTPVLSISEAPLHKHHQQRKTYVDIDGLIQPAPAPRYSRSKTKVQHTQHSPGQDTREILKAIDYENEQISQLFDQGVIA